MRKPVAVLIAAVAVMGLVAVSLAQPSGEEPGRREGPGPGRGFGPPMPVIEALDADRDGQLSAEEIAAASQALKKLDKDGDGKLSAEELRPRGFGPGGPGGPGFPGGPGGPRTAPAAFQSTPLAKDDAEKKVLAVLEEMGKHRTAGGPNVPRDDGRILRLLAESLGAKHVVELGTSNGYSGVWFCLALRTTGGKLTTYEIDADRAAQARENFKRAGVADIATVVEGDAHVEVKKLKETIDLVFIDADKEGYLDYLEKLLPLVRPGGLIVAHNMSERQADPRYVKAITTNPAVETVFLNVQTSGIGVTLKKR